MDAQGRDQSEAAPSIKDREWRLVLAVVAVSCATVAFLYFTHYPAIASGRRTHPFSGLLLFGSLLLILSAPIHWANARLDPGPPALFLIKAHGAVFSWFLLMVVMPILGEPLVSVVFVILLFVFGIEGTIIAP